jgi:orotidine-5'-phosphate decarboxylase
VWGLDPAGALLEAWGLGDDPDGLDRFADIMLDAAAGTVGLVKPQSAFFERHGWRGLRTLSRLIAEARSAGLLVVLDVKRGAVVGPARIEPELDLARAQALFLAPGVGAQGATPEDVAEVFASCPSRVMPSASRSLLRAGPGIGALQDGAAALAAEFRRLLPAPGKAAARTP